jgi:uncharacterized membrane protein YphA (DoxX/SURF4 family)
LLRAAVAAIYFRSFRPLNDNKTSLGVAAMVVLALLRLALGWHFFMEGAKKFHDPDFTSANLFSTAKGPFKGLYDAQIADPYGEDRLRSDAEEGYSMAQQWHEDRYAAYAHYGFSEEQQELGDAKYDQANDKLQVFLLENKEDIEEYFRELERLHEAKQSPSAHDLPFEMQRLEDKEKELKKKMLGWSNQIKAMGRVLQDDLYGIADGDQQARGKYLFRNPAPMLIDRIVPWVLVIAGMLLLLGFLTPVGSALGCVFLLGVMGTQPPWVPGTDPIYNQVVEFLALLTVAVTGAGRFGGLDHFVELAINRCCGAEDDDGRAT